MCPAKVPSGELARLRLEATGALTMTCSIKPESLDEQEAKALLQQNLTEEKAADQKPK